MQRRIATYMLRQLRDIGWTHGEVVTLRKGVFGIDVTATTGERCHFATVDEIRLKVRLLAHTPEMHHTKAPDGEGDQHDMN